MEDGADAKERHEGLLDVCWEVMLSKCGGTERWNPNKRCCGCPSSFGPKSTADDEEPQPYIHFTDEAFVVWTWENKVNLWIWENTTWDKKDENNNPQPKEVVLPDGTKLTEEPPTPYTDKKCGQKKFGGITKIGLKRYKELCVMIKKNREDNAEAIKEVEEACLARLRKAKGRDKIDENRRGRRAGRAENDDDDNEDEEEEEDDCDDWH